MVDARLGYCVQLCRPVAISAKRVLTTSAAEKKKSYFANVFFIVFTAKRARLRCRRRFTFMCQWIRRKLYTIQSFALAGFRSPETILNLHDKATSMRRRLRVYLQRVFYVTMALLPFERMSYVDGQKDENRQH